MLATILLWLKNNWLLVAALALAAALYFYGDHNGYGRADAKWKADVQAERDARQKEKDDLQAKADAAAKSYEDYRAATDMLLDDLNAEVENAKKKNAAFASCHAGPDFVRIYERAAAGAGGQGPR